MSDDEKILTIKSVVHDATPSWNGFNYQGKVGLYVSLSFLEDICKSVDFDVESIKEIAVEYSIEYEWVEDFSIKYKGEYKSIHQVKHYNATAFSEYLDAFETAALRRVGIISAADAIPYCSKEDNKKISEVATSLISHLLSKKLLTEEQRISEGWKDKLADVDEKYRDNAERFLTSLDALQKNAYSSSVPIFVHSCLPISGPVKDISTYKWNEDVVENIFKDKSLADLKIYIKKEGGINFDLSNSDNELLAKIKDLIISLKIKMSPSDLRDELTASADCYIAALLMELDAHIASRHENYSGNNLTKSASRVLSFRKIVDILNERYRKQDRNYFALRVKLLFEIFLNEYLQHLDENISEAMSDGDDYSEFIDRKNKLLDFRLGVISKMTPDELLGHIEKCSPELKKTPLDDIYYSRVISKSGVNDVFLKFIEELNSTPSGFHATCTDGLRYAPSFIDASNQDGKPELVHKRIAKLIAMSCDHDAYIGALLYNFDFIAIKAKDGFEHPYPITPPLVGEAPADKSEDMPPVFHEPKKTQLLNYKIAAKKINGLS